MSQEKLIVALDVPGIEQAEKLVQTLTPTVKIFKVGKELFTSAGPQVIEMIHGAGARVFLDLKFHDIPNTVGAACEAAVRLGVFMVNVHALGGKNMMQKAVQCAHQEAERLKKKPPLVIGVTVLTSMTDQDLVELGIQKKLTDQVRDLALLAKSSGLDGVVASAWEIELVRKAAGSGFLVVTPAVRPSWAPNHDQKRVMTPKEAVEKGASFIVVGRPVTGSVNPRDAAAKIIDEMHDAR